MGVTGKVKELPPQCGTLWHLKEVLGLKSIGALTAGARKLKIESLGLVEYRGRIGEFYSHNDLLRIAMSLREHSKFELPPELISWLKWELKSRGIEDQ